MPAKKTIIKSQQLNSPQSGFAPILLLIVFSLIAASGFAGQVTLTEEFAQNNNITAVLGDEMENISEEEKKILEQQKENEEKLKEAEKRKREKNSEQKELKNKEEKLKFEKEQKELLIKKQKALRETAEKQRKEKESTNTAVRKKMIESESKDETDQLERELEELELELKSDEDDQKVVMEQKIDGLKLKYKYENGKLVVKAQAENGLEVDVDDPQIASLTAQLEKQLREKGFEIATGASEIKIGNKKIKAKSKFPVSVDALTNQLTIETPKGTKIVTVLPDQAVENMLKKQVITEVESEEESEIELQERNDKIVYKMKGKKTHNVIGFIPVKTDTTAFVSAENGELVAKEESAFSRLLGFISF